jgi:hypothetical protein
MAAKIKRYFFILATALSAFTAACTPVNKPQEVNLSAEDKALKNWVLSYCFASTLEPGAAKQDALNTAGAYLQAGNQPIEAYEKATEMINTYLAKSYEGVTPGAFNTKKCIDLYQSHELELLVHEHRK